MIINIDIDEEELKTQILDGLSVDSAIAGAINSCKYELQNQLEKAIKKTPEYKNVYSAGDDSKRIKDVIKKIAQKSVLEAMKNEIRTYVVLESQLPKVVKSHVNDFLKEYVDEEITKQIRKVYSIEIGIRKNVKIKEGSEGEEGIKSKKDEEA